MPLTELAQLIAMRGMASACAKSLRAITFAHDQLELRWITVGGSPDGSGKHHVGGTPVKIDPQGGIVAGPAKLKGKKVDELGKGRQPAEPKTATPAPVVDPARQFGLYAKDAKGNAVEVGERPGQANLFGREKYRLADPPKPEKLVSPQFDPRNTMEMFPTGVKAESPEPAKAPKTLPEKTEAVEENIAQSKAKREAERKRLVEDFGEKIGGARKDLATPLGPRPKRDREPDERPAWRRKYAAGQDAKTGGWFLHDNDGHLIGRQTYKTKEDAEAAVPLIEVARNHRVHQQGRRGEPEEYAIVRKVSDRKHPVVKGGFKTSDEAMKYMAAHPAEIIEHKFPFPEKPWLDHIDRKGKTHRTGDVRTGQFQETFGFRGGEFGNWNMGGDGQAALNHAYDALMDLSDTLGVPPKALSLDGKLSIAFGARGHGGKDSARAHYERNADRPVINLTKIKGAGSLAHEWFHALDHYVGQTEKSREAMATGGFRYSSKARPELEKAFQDAVSAMTAKAVDKPITPQFEAERVAAQHRYVTRNLGELRAELAQDFSKSNSPKLRKRKSVTPEQLKEWDHLSEQVLSGKLGEPKVISGGRFNFRKTYDPVEKLNDLYKQVTGRSFATLDENSRGKRLVAQIDAAQDAVERLAAAEQGAKETKWVATDYFNEARKIDNYRASDYWSTPEEMGARAFESYIFDKIAGQQNRSDYLVHGVENRHYAGTGMKPYPEGEERKAINAAFERLFKAIQHERRKDDQGREHVRMYSADALDRLNAANRRTLALLALA